MLLVEDNADVIDALRILLEHNGYRVSAATSVAEAVQIGVHDSPGVVLLDLALDRGEDGLEVLARWRECGVAIPKTVALTGHADEDTRLKCTAAGCDAVLVKPVTSAALMGQIRELS